MTNRQPKDQIKGTIRTFLARKTQPADKKSIIDALYPNGYDNNQGNSVTVALKELRTAGEVLHPAWNKWLPA